MQTMAEKTGIKAKKKAALTGQPFSIYEKKNDQFNILSNSPAFCFIG